MPQSQSTIDNPFFTVVIPTYNRSSLLKRAIASVLKQTFKCLEIVIVDDCSTDDTSSVVRSFSDPRIRYLINSRTKGASGARNTGIFAAKGKWVAFLDDDDVWLPEKLNYQYQKAKELNNAIGLICTDYSMFKDKQRKPAIFKNRPSVWAMDKLLYGYSIGCLSSVVIRIDILKKINGFDERFPSCQDWDLWLRTAEVCQVDYVPKMLVIMHQETRVDRIGQNSKAKLEGHVLLREKYSTIIDSNLRLRHRHASLIFTFAILEGDRRLILKCLSWFFVGFYIDTVNFARTVRSIIIFLFRKYF